MRFLGLGGCIGVVVGLGLALGAAGCDDGGGGDEVVPEGCSTLVTASSSDDYAALQTAFIDASSGDVICLKAGTYALDRELSLASHRDITVRGVGDTRDDVVLDFAGQEGGDDGMTVTADGFAIGDLTIKNSPGNGIVVHADQSRFSNIKVSWDAGAVTENGAYAVYPNDCTRTIIEDSEITGASDAGIYVGSCEFAIVRRNTVYANVAGIEIENTLYADVYDNDVYDNSAGILAFVLPNLKIKEAKRILIRDNRVYDNNRDNFAEKGSIVSFVPKGTGLLVLAAKELEVRDNVFHDNDSASVLLVSFGIMKLLAGIDNDDEDMDPYVERVYVHGNTHADNGGDPALALSAIGQVPLENVLWDGDTRSEDADPLICLGGAPTSFRNFASPESFAAEAQSTDTAGHTCTLDPLPEMSGFEDMVAP